MGNTPNTSEFGQQSAVSENGDLKTATAEKIISARLRLSKCAVKDSMDDLLQRTLDEVCNLTNSPIGFYHFVEKDQKTISLQMWSTKTLKDFCKTEGKGLHYSIDKAGVWVDCIHERRPIIHNDYNSLKHKKGYPSGHAPISRELVVPIFRGEIIVAVLGVGNKPRNYDENDINIVESFADLAFDIADIKKSTENVKRNEFLLNQTQKLTKVGGWEWDIPTQKMYWTEQTYRIHGINSKDILFGSQKHIEKSLNCYSPDDQKIIIQAFNHCVEKGESYDLEFPLTRMNGEKIWIRTLGKPYIVDSKIEKVIGNIVDISEQKASQKLAKAQLDLSYRLGSKINDFEETLKLCFETALSVSNLDSGGIYLLNENTGGMDLVYHAGLSEAFVNGVKHFDKKTDNVKMIMSGVPIFANHRDLEIQLNDSERREKLKAMGIIPIRFQEKVIGSLNIASHSSGSISEPARLALETISNQIGSSIYQVKTKKALVDSDKKFETLFHKAPLSYQSLDRDGDLIEVNDTWLNLLGYEKEDVIGKNFGDFLIPKWKDDFKNNLSVLKSIGEVLGVEFELIKKDGSTILISLNGSISKDKEGDFVQSHCIFSDISRQRRLEEEKEAMEQKMNQMQKIESIGSLAGGIAHDFNNILFPIMGMSEILMEDLPKGTDEYECAQEILMAGKRGSDLVNQILSFSRQHEHKLMPIRIEKILKEVIKLSRSTIPTNIEIRNNIQQGSGLVMGDPTQIHQIAMNLITNAFHAVEEKNGKIDIEFKEIDLKNEKIPESLLQLGRYVKLSVSDNGIGMTQSVIEKIFEPYFTTKAKGKGTGLGLAVVYGIVQVHKGDIKVYSEVGKGSTFSIYLPLIEKSTKDVSTEKISELETGIERILLVDDEKPIIKLEGQMLKRLGYQVTAYSNSEEALIAFTSDPQKYDLVITDMTMPGITGDKLAKEILSIAADIPIIICTGFSERINKEQAKNIGVKGLLMKPVVKSEMAHMVRKVLDESKSSFDRL